MNTTKVTVAIPSHRVAAFVKILEGFSMTLPEGEDLTILMQDVKEKKSTGPTVQYRAVSGSEALEMLGETTMRGIVYKHLLVNGPKTVADIMQKLGHGLKSVESSVDKLKTAGVVVPEPVGTEPMGPPPAKPNGYTVIPE